VKIERTALCPNKKTGRKSPSIAKRIPTRAGFLDNLSSDPSGTTEAQTAWSLHTPLSLSLRHSELGGTALPTSVQTGVNLLSAGQVGAKYAIEHTIGSWWPAKAPNRCARPRLRGSERKVLQPNSIVGGRYQAVRLLGGGGMKQVWRARDQRLGGRACALAEMTDIFQNPTARKTAEAAFKREAELLGKLSNDHIPHVYDHFSEGNAHFLVMEYIRGQTLEQMLKATPRLAEREAISIALQIADTLEYLHSCKPPVIYRDLKPSNVIIEPSGHLVLVDFGIARHFQAPKTDTMVGTPGYAAPEQWKGKAEPRSDVYAVGALMHQLLSGRDPTLEPPFSFPPLEKLCLCSSGLAALVNDCLKYELADRVSSITVFRQRLIEAEAGANAAQAPTVKVKKPSTESGVKSISTSSVAFGTLGILGLFFIGFIAVEVMTGPEKTPTPVPSPAIESTLPVEPSPLPTAIPYGGVAAYKAKAASPIATPALPTPEPTFFVHSRRHKAARHHGYFTIGSTRAEVLALQGTPSSILNFGVAGDTWMYGVSSVEFDPRGKVNGYSNLGGNLHVSMTSASSVEPTQCISDIISQKLQWSDIFTTSSGSLYVLISRTYGLASWEEGDRLTICRKTVVNGSQTFSYFLITNLDHAGTYRFRKE